VTPLQLWLIARSWAWGSVLLGHAHAHAPTPTTSRSLHCALRKASRDSHLLDSRRRGEPAASRSFVLRDSSADSLRLPMSQIVLQHPGPLRFLPAGLRRLPSESIASIIVAGRTAMNVESQRNRASVLRYHDGSTGTGYQSRRPQEGTVRNLDQLYFPATTATSIQGCKI
jgi:hypothetical protein